MSRSRLPELATLVLWGLSLSATVVSQEPTTLVVGKVAAGQADLARAQVQLFRDAKCTDLAYSSKSIGAQGTYAIQVKPGTYYPRLHVDVNGNQKVDERDLIGLFGVTDASAAGAAPKAVTVKAGEFRTDVNIEASAVVRADGSLAPLVAAPTVWIVGQVVWPGHDLSQAKVQLFRDPACKDLAAAAQAITPQGSFAVAVPAGTYYARALADLNGSGKLDQGEGLGYFGVTDMADTQQRPQPIAVSEAQFLVTANILICAVLGEGGVLKAVPVSTGQLQQRVHGRVNGVVKWPGYGLERVWVLCAAEVGCQKVLGVSRVRPDGVFSLLAEVGKAVVIAIADANANSRVDAGDQIGIAGITDFANAQASPQQFEVMVGQALNDIEVSIVGQLADGGAIGPAQGADGAGRVRLDPAQMPALLVGAVVWPGEQVTAGEVNAFTDPELKQHVAQAPLESAGEFGLALPAGEYYLLGAADRDGDGTASEGDGIGLYGVADLFSPQPKQPLALKAGELREGLQIIVTARVGGPQGIEPLKAPAETGG